MKLISQFIVFYLTSLNVKALHLQRPNSLYTTLQNLQILPQVQSNSITQLQLKNNHQEAITQKHSIAQEYNLYKSKEKQLKQKIDKAYSTALPSLQRFIPLQQEILQDKNLDSDLAANMKIVLYQCKNNPQKYSSTTEDKLSLSANQNIYVSEMGDQNFLVFSKYPYFIKHLLLVSKQYENQDTTQLVRLSEEDYKQNTLVIQAVNGVFFHSIGPESAHSQLHKHIQIIPQQSYNFTIINQIHSDIENDKLIKISEQNNQDNISIYKFRGYQSFVHGIVLIHQSVENLDQNDYQRYLQRKAQEYKKAENALYSYLSAKLKMEKFSFNIIGSNKLLAIIPRKSRNILGSGSINPTCFMGCLFLKEWNEFLFLKLFNKPAEIWQYITYSQISK